MAKNKLIGKVLATEKNPTTIDEFYFWTNSDTKLNAFDIVKVECGDGTNTFGVIESISHITDETSFLTSFISSDFGDVDISEPTFRVGMNYAYAKVSYNTKGDYTPVHNNSKVFLASIEEITFALGLDKVENPLVCGSLKMYEGTEDEVTLPVNLNAKFLLGSEGAHLNISGISGLAAKTSYAMFLMKAIQDTYANKSDEDDSVAFVLFNVKGRDLMAIDRPNEELDDKTIMAYEKLNLSQNPFQQAKYYITYYDSKSTKQSTYLLRDDVSSYIESGKLKKFKYVYGDAVKTIYNLKLGEYDNELRTSPPSRIVIFIDELNKYASSDVPKSSRILRQILDVTERGRSLGVVLFGAEQFRSAIHKRVTGNCATHAFGRTNSIETSSEDYRSLPSTYRNMLTRLSQGEYLIQNPVFRSFKKLIGKTA